MCKKFLFWKIHDWRAWQVNDSATTERRSCRRCGERQERKHRHCWGTVTETSTSRYSTTVERYQQCVDCLTEDRADLFEDEDDDDDE